MIKLFPFRRKTLVAPLAVTGLLVAAALSAGPLAKAANMRAASHFSSQQPPGARAGGRTLPAHLFAPYIETYAAPTPATLAKRSKAKYLTMAFIQSPSPHSCAITWNGNTKTSISRAVYGNDIAAIRASGGDVIPSFGGYAADHQGTEIADNCTDVNAIAAAYEKVVTTYNVSRIDLDVEDNSLTNTAGIERRNKAIRQAEEWAARHHRALQFSYTLPAYVNGLNRHAVQLLRNAVQNHARVDVVNIMTFDYYDNRPHEMATDTKRAATATIHQLHKVYPAKSVTGLWHSLGVTEMIGIDDFGPAETFTTADAAAVETWGNSLGIALISFWALQRDNGNCSGTAGNDGCSGVTQSAWQYSHIFEPFTKH